MLPNLKVLAICSFGLFPDFSDRALMRLGDHVVELVIATEIIHAIKMKAMNPCTFTFDAAGEPSLETLYL
jgi:hypothetical protein